MDFTSIHSIFTLLLPYYYNIRVYLLLIQPEAPDDDGSLHMSRVSSGMEGKWS